MGAAGQRPSSTYPACKSQTSNKNARGPKEFNDKTLKETFHRQVEQPAYITSLLSLVQGATELTTLYPGDVNLMAAVVKAWDEMSKRHLLGKAIWNIRTKKLLGILDAPPPAIGAAANV